MMLIDTHCHIHDADYPLNAEEVIENAHKADVLQMICVGTNETDSRLALDFAKNHDGVFAAIGLYPQYSAESLDWLPELITNSNKKLVAIGEIGLDYHYDDCPHDVQIKALKLQIELAVRHNLPIIFHVREAFDDFWTIYDSYKDSNIRGVLHSFTDNAENAQKGIDRNLFIGVNGYSTFTKDESQKKMFASLPIDKMLFETDAPFLTPAPLRGKVNESAYVKNIAQFHSAIRGISLEKIADITTTNAKTLFNL